MLKLTKFFEVFVLPAAILIAVLGCKGEVTTQQSGNMTPTSATGQGSSEASAVNSNQSNGGTQSESGFATGRVTLPDGKPLGGDIKDISISISGVSEAAERVSYTPIVKPDGTYRQKLAGGQYQFNPSKIKVNFGNHQFDFPLEPVGNNSTKNQDAADGIEQDFVWKVTGPTPYGQSQGLDPNNATHWYGMSVGLRASGYRDDIKAAPTPIPDDTVLVFQLKPTSKSIDEQELQPITVKRKFRNDSLSNVDINDVPPANYELSGTAELPDGSKKPILLQGKDEYPSYKESISVRLEKDNLLGGMWKHPLSFVLE